MYRTERRKRLQDSKHPCPFPGKRVRAATLSRCWGNLFWKWERAFPYPSAVVGNGENTLARSLGKGYVPPPFPDVGVIYFGCGNGLSRTLPPSWGMGKTPLPVPWEKGTCRHPFPMLGNLLQPRRRRSLRGQCGTPQPTSPSHSFKVSRSHAGGEASGGQCGTPQPTSPSHSFKVSRSHAGGEASRAMRHTPAHESQPFLQGITQPRRRRSLRRAMRHTPAHESKPFLQGITQPRRRRSLRRAMRHTPAHESQPFLQGITQPRRRRSLRRAMRHTPAHESQPFLQGITQPRRRRSLRRAMRHTPAHESLARSVWKESRTVAIFQTSGNSLGSAAFNLPQQARIFSFGENTLARSPGEKGTCRHPFPILG